MNELASATAYNGRGEPLTSTDPLHPTRTEALLLLLARYPKLVERELSADECSLPPGQHCNALTEAFLRRFEDRFGAAPVVWQAAQLAV